MTNLKHLRHAVTANTSPTLTRYVGASRFVTRKVSLVLDRMIHVPLIIAAIVTLVSCGNESFTEAASTKAPLVTGFESYLSLEEVIPRLPSSMKPVVLEDSSLSLGDQRPPFSIYSISVRGFRHIGHEGELKLVFFNNRLQETVFYPANPATYLAALKTSGIALLDGQELRRGNTVIWQAVDYQRRSYIGWADIRLRDQSRRWISRYS